MGKDDKYRVIGKVVAITSDRFTIELLSGIENFNVNGFDDIHYFAQVGSYIILPYQNYHIVTEIVSVKERDTILPNNNPTEQILNKSKSIKYLEVTPIGTISIDNKFSFGVSVYPPLYSDVLYIKQQELDCIFNIENVEVLVNDDYKNVKDKTHGNNTRLQSLSIGKSTVFEDYDIKVDIDKFFGSHSAILGNTGSGKSCTISSMLQILYKKNSYAAVGSTFLFLDVNGEYMNAFSVLNETNSDIQIKYFSIDSDELESKFFLPHWFLSFEEWALLLNASEKTQLPILRNALGLATLFASDNSECNKKVKNHILAACILTCYESSDSPVTKYQRIKSLVSKGGFNNDILTNYDARFGNFPNQDAEKNFISTIKNHIDINGFEIPTYNNTFFSFDLFEECLDIAILFEEAHGNKQIRDYCSSLLTRFKSLRDRKDFDFLKNNAKDTNVDSYILNLTGLKREKDSLCKESQIIILDLNSCEDEVVEIISCVISRLSFEKLKTAEPRNHFPINLVLEEAHRYISLIQERTFLKANHIFERIAKEGRKYGMFLMISSQRPSELSKTVLSQCSNFIVHRIQNPEDLSHIRQITPHVSETVLKRLPSIPTQQALIFGQAVNLPSMFKVHTANPLPKSDNNKVSRNWFIAKDSEISIKFQ